MRKILIILFSITYGSGNLFADNYGHLIYFDQTNAKKDIVYVKVDNYAITEGDIILKKFNKNIAPQATILAKFRGGRWQNGIMPFKISTKFSPQCQYSILTAIKNWNKKTNIKFVEIDKKNAYKYPDYVNFIPSHSNTSSSFVGRQGGEQPININAKCNDMSVAHEIGHALGLWHEQSRNDRDRYIKIIWDNIDAKHTFNFNQHLADGEDIGEYDYNSIMHYSAYAFSKNGKQTIIPLLANAKIGQRKKISKKDIAAINYMYQNSVIKQ